ncbi:MAG: S41 family peptidase [Archangium sp.]|nr:S41 family peptidase [Archangium sp.]
MAQQHRRGCCVRRAVDRRSSHRHSRPARACDVRPAPPRASEELAYDLQTTKRATIIGETTRGGAHVTKTVSLDDWFALAVPHAASISPVTHGNWEGTGVVPDVPTSADAALDEALKRALADLKRP